MQHIRRTTHSSCETDTVCSLNLLRLVFGHDPSPQSVNILNSFLPPKTSLLYFMTPDVLAYWGYMSAIEYVRTEAQAECTWKGFIAAIDSGNVELVRDLWKRKIKLDDASNTMDWAAGSGHVEMVRLFRSFGIMVQGIHADTAAAHGCLDIIRYFRSIGIHCSEKAPDKAAKGGHVHVLRDLFEHEHLSCTRKGANDAAMNGYLEAVKYLHEHQSLVPFNDQALIRAARNNELEMVKYLHELGVGGRCADEDAVDVAIVYGKLEVVKYFHSKGVIMRKQSRDDAMRNGHMEVVIFLQDKQLEDHFDPRHGRYCGYDSFLGATWRT